MNACLSCRKVKMKCRPSGQDGTKCERCARKSIDCVFQRHRRGRKPGTRVGNQQHSSAASPLVGHAVLGPPPLGTSRGDGVNNTLGLTGGEGQESDKLPIVAEDNLQPSGVLNREAMRGKFSLRHILSTSDGADLLDPRENGDSYDPVEDPIALGFVNFPMAKSLFENFIATLNPYICQLDPTLHTFAFVRQTSPFLFSAILAMAAKAFSPGMYQSLYRHAEHLFVESFRRGTKSVETVQATLILTYWKQPQDTRAWTSLGYVIRMCMDMGWHRLAPSSVTRQSTMSEQKRRELRNVERTWYVLFVYDRSMSLQTGRPWMIERNGFIESAQDWCDDPVGIANDRLLSAFVTLRLLASEVFALLAPKPWLEKTELIQHIESLLSCINDRIARWEERWSKEVCQTAGESCHPFMVRFYGTHLRLQLFTLPLQDILASSEPGLVSNMGILWVAYSGAMDMLQLISKYSSKLYFAQDSIHVMTAYSAAFLVKLLLSTPASITERIEITTVEAIRTAASVFSRQAAPPGSSCALQARFLQKVVSNLLGKRGDRLRATIDGGAIEVGASLGPPPPLRKTLSESTATELDQFGESAAILSREAAASRMQPEHHRTQPGELDLLFTDDETWSYLFASAGFSTQDGVFLA